MIGTPLFAAKKSTNGGGGSAELDLPPGPGVSAVTIPELDEALKDYRLKRDIRCAATKEEVPAKEAVLTLFHKHAAELADQKGVLRYKLQDDAEIVEVFIEAAKEKVKFGKKDSNADDS